MVLHFVQLKLIHFVVFSICHSNFISAGKRASVVKWYRALYMMPVIIHLPTFILLSSDTEMVCQHTYMTSKNCRSSLRGFGSERAGGVFCPHDNAKLKIINLLTQIWAAVAVLLPHRLLAANDFVSGSQWFLQRQRWEKNLNSSIILWSNCWGVFRSWFITFEPNYRSVCPTYMCFHMMWNDISVRSNISVLWTSILFGHTSSDIIGFQ